MIGCLLFSALVLEGKEEIIKPPKIAPWRQGLFIFPPRINTCPILEVMIY